MKACADGAYRLSKYLQSWKWKCWYWSCKDSASVYLSLIHISFPLLKGYKTLFTKGEKVNVRNMTIQKTFRKGRMCGAAVQNTEDCIFFQASFSVRNSWHVHKRQEGNMSWLPLHKRQKAHVHTCGIFQPAGFTAAPVVPLLAHPA